AQKAKPGVKVERLKSELAPQPSDADETQPNLLEDTDATNKLIRQQVTADVNQALDEARRRMSQDPAQVVAALKQQVAQVDRIVELDPETRAQLRGKLVDGLKQAQLTQVEFEERS